ncbi:MAG: pyruvate kinase alpha/beta domain-containing protein, partial [Dehalococcoidia bacterium]
CVYFPKGGRENTDEVLSIARKRAQELGIKTIVVAATGGDTAAKAVKLFQGQRVVVVTHATGFHSPNTQELTEENRAEIEGGGGIILTCLHAFAGVGRAVRRKFATYQVEEIMAHTLKIFGQGMKVVVEVVLMAADAGLVRTDEEVISIAGQGRGADTAVVLKPANSQDFFDLRVKEILCKPRL